MEIQDCLQELLYENNSEDGVQFNYFDLVASQDSLISFEGVKILPPLLSNAEKRAMREHRRKAVDVEQKLFEARREKYTNLLLKVMDITDKFQRKEEKTKKKSSRCSNEKEITSVENISQEAENVLGKAENKTKGEKADYKTNKSMKILQENEGNNNNNRVQKWEKSNAPNITGHSPDFPLIFQKPKLHTTTTTTSPRRNKADSNNMSGRSTTSQSIHELNGTSETLKYQTLDRESLTSSSGTLTTNDQSLHRELLDNRRGVNASDSLASTVLSIAFTDSSVASQQSAMEGTQNLTVKTVQRQLNMDNLNQNVYQSYYHNVNPLTSTPNDLQRPETRSSQRQKKKSPVKFANTAVKKDTQTYSEQDRALEKLEMMRKKLSEEKERQIALIRQQELARLRRNKDQQKHFVLSKETDIDSEKAEIPSQGQVTSRLGSDMYSIPERSFEGSISLRENDQNDVESASDKENNHYRYDPQQRMYHDINSVVHYEGDNRSITPLDSAQQNIRNTRDGPFSTSPYIRQEFLKQLQVLKNQQCGGNDKFSILTAYSKGFITRRLLQAEKVKAIIKTIKDTKEFLADISKEGTSSHQDKSLQKRVQSQLVAAKTKFHDIFFKIPVQDRMAYIAHSRNLAKEREERQYDKSQKSARKLSSATLKAMQRRNIEQNENCEVKKTSTRSPLGKRRNWDIRVLKPVQSSKSPQLQEKGRLVGKRRPATAPSPRHSIIKKSTYSNRPATALATRLSNRKSVSRRSVENDIAPSRRQPRTSLEGKLQTVVKRVKSNDEEKDNSKLPVRKSLGGRLTYRVPIDEGGSQPQQQSVHRPSRRSVGPTRQASVKQEDTLINNRQNTSSGTRRTTRSMAAKFNKS